MSWKAICTHNFLFSNNYSIPILIVYQDGPNSAGFQDQVQEVDNDEHLYQALGQHNADTPCKQ